MDGEAGFLILSIDSGLYCKAAVLSAAQRYTRDYFVAVDQTEGTIAVKFIQRVPLPEVPRHLLEAQFKTDLIDHERRSDLEKVFGPIRDKIVAKAFGRGE